MEREQLDLWHSRLVELIARADQLGLERPHPAPPHRMCNNGCGSISHQDIISHQKWLMKREQHEMANQEVR